MNLLVIGLNTATGRPKCANARLAPSKSAKPHLFGAAALHEAAIIRPHRVKFTVWP
jgi:hypothetical protein